MDLVRNEGLVEGTIRGENWVGERPVNGSEMVVLGAVRIRQMRLMQRIVLTVEPSSGCGKRFWRALIQRESSRWLVVLLLRPGLSALWSVAPNRAYAGVNPTHSSEQKR